MKALIILMLYLLIFSAIFGVSVYDFIHNQQILDIGLSANQSNLIIMALSALAIIKTTWHIYSY